jgi:glycine oxidase
MRLAVIGAGVFGLCTALRAAHAGATVEVFDPAPPGDNASGVAAGMIAPVGEWLFDRDAPLPFDLLRAGRDGWSGVQALAPDLKIDPCGARLRFPDQAALHAAFDLARSVGASASIDQTDPVSLRLWTPEDWRVDPKAAMLALWAAVIGHGGVMTPRRLAVDKFADFDAVVLAAGIGSRDFAEAAPELLTLEPIKGQMARIATPVASPGPILRTPDLYLAPQTGVVLVGATMERGRNDTTVDMETILALRRRALDLQPGLESVPFEGLAGVRAGAPDGLPLAGPSSRSGLYLATGARRNGWLLAPLVSQILVSYLSGGDGGPFAAALDPRRFTRA